MARAAGSRPPAPAGTHTGPAVATGVLDDRAVEVLARLVELLDEPQAAAVLAPLAERELHVRAASRCTRLEVRIQSEAKQRIEEAAALSGESASDFVRQAAIARAEEILRRREQTLVPPDFFEALLRELDEPPVRNQRLTNAAERGRDMLVHEDQ